LTSPSPWQRFAWPFPLPPKGGEGIWKSLKPCLKEQI
jgi:hypothetical protein